MKAKMERCAALSKSDDTGKSINTPAPLDQLCEELEQTLNINNCCTISPLMT
jgi:hypothetical protein